MFHHFKIATTKTRRFKTNGKLIHNYNLRLKQTKLHKTGKHWWRYYNFSWLYSKHSWLFNGLSDLKDSFFSLFIYNHNIKYLAHNSWNIVLPPDHSRIVGTLLNTIFLDNICAYISSIKNLYSLCNRTQLDTFSCAWILLPKETCKV